MQELINQNEKDQNFTSTKNIKEYKQFRLFYLSFVLLTLILFIAASSIWYAAGFDTDLGDKGGVTNFVYFGLRIGLFILFSLSLIIATIVIPFVYLNNKIEYQKTDEFKK